MSSSTVDPFKGKTKEEIVNYFIDLHIQTQNNHLETDKAQIILGEILRLVEEIDQVVKGKSKSKKKDSEAIEVNDSTNWSSSNLYKLIARTLAAILEIFPSKVHDIANSLLDYVKLDDNGKYSESSNFSTILLIDIFEKFPSQGYSLISYAIALVYKILKKSPICNSNLVFLMNTLLENASKATVDEKMQAKILKLSIKTITQSEIIYGLPEEEEVSSNIATSTINSKVHFILVVKRLLILSISSKYEDLLAAYVTSNSASKSKSESVMSHQHQYQLSILATHQKLFEYGFCNASKEIRVATADLMANILVNFIPSPKFDILEFLIKSIIMPEIDSEGEFFDSFVYPKDIEAKDSVNVLNDKFASFWDSAEARFMNSGILKTLVFYIQIKQIESPDFLTNNLLDILDHLLEAFFYFSNLKFQNQNLDALLKHLKAVVSFLINACGVTCHEILSSYLIQKFSSKKSDETAENTNKQTFAYNSRNSDPVLFNLNISKLKIKSKKEVINYQPYVNYYQCAILLHIVDTLIPFGVDFDCSGNISSSGSLDKSHATKQDIENNSTELVKHDLFLKKLLFKLLENKTDGIRLRAAHTLLVYAKYKEIEVNGLVSFLYDTVQDEYNSTEKRKIDDRTLCTDPELRLTSYSYALSLIIKSTPSTLLSHSLILRILGFCTQNLKHNSNANMSKNCCCWLILSSVITLYEEFDFVKLNSSQLLVFWKNIFTSQFVNDSSTSPEVSERLIIRNLKLRNSSLLCLFNYLTVVELTPELLKTLQFLLTKSYNYTTFLENQFPEVEKLTSFSPSFFDSNLPFNILNNIQYKDLMSDKSIPSTVILASLIFYNKKILIQGINKLISLSKYEVNSNMIIFLVHLFSDTKMFSFDTSSDSLKVKQKYKSKKFSTINDLNCSVMFLNNEATYSYGSTTLYNSAYVAPNENSFINDKFNPKVSLKGFENVNYSSGNIQDTDFNDSIGDVIYNWFDYFDENLFCSTDYDLLNDPNNSLFMENSRSLLSPNIITSLVDLSIETFSYSFPVLTSKIQLSILEQIRNSLELRSVDSLRKKAVILNLSLALNKMLQFCLLKNVTFETNIIESCINILGILSDSEISTIELNSNTVGMCCSIVKDKNSFSTIQISSIINLIIKSNSPYVRKSCLLSLSQIYKYSNVGFKDIFDVMFQLMRDPNPVVYATTLKSMNQILSSNSSEKLYLVPKVLDVLFKNYFNDEFSYEYSVKSLVNLNSKYGSNGQVTKLLKTCISIMGPNIVDQNDVVKNQIRALLVCLRYCIGCANIKENSLVLKNLMGLLSELIIFDAELLKNEVAFFKSLLNILITKHLKLGLGVVPATSLNENCIFPFNTSSEIYQTAFECYLELVKIFGYEITKEDRLLLWIAMEVNPCSYLREIIIIWIDSDTKTEWITTLLSLYKISIRRLVDPFIDQNFGHKLLPFFQREKKEKSSSLEFKDEEIQNIFSSDIEYANKLEPISWELKKFIYDLLNRYLDRYLRSDTNKNYLIPRIQELVNLAYLGSLSPITALKLGGIHLLNKILEVFGDLEDSNYPGASVLEQQQAQIISSLVPCFTSNCDPCVVVEALTVSSKFINLPRIKFYSKFRILDTIIRLLEEVSSNKFIKFKHLEGISEYSRKEIQLSILNCWAILKLQAFSEQETEEELSSALAKYHNLLSSLWIVTLRDYAVLKYTSSSSNEVTIYHDYWLNFMDVMILQINDANFVEEFLQEEELSFAYLLFGLCFECLLKKQHINRLLNSIENLVKNHKLVALIFEDQLFCEFTDLIERLILLDDSTDMKMHIASLIQTLFNSYCTSHNSENVEVPKLFELLRLYMLPIFTLLPFLKLGFDKNDLNDQSLLNKTDHPTELLLLQKYYSGMIIIIEMFDDENKIDLYTCVLYMFIKIYESKNEKIISSLVPQLKIVFEKVLTIPNTTVLLEESGRLIFEEYEVDSAIEYTVLTTLVLLNFGGITLTKENSQKIAQILIEYLDDPLKVNLSVSCIKGIISRFPNPNTVALLKNILNQIITSITNNSKSNNKKLLFEILILFAKSKIGENKMKLIYGILVPILLHFSIHEDLVDDVYIHQRTVFLMNYNPNAFKYAINTNLTSKQRALTEKIIRTNSNFETNDLTDNEPVQIHLKNFGS